MNNAVVQLMEKARRSLSAARSLLERGDGDFAASRAYYAMFYAAEAALLARGMSFSKHSAVISAFGRELVKTGALPEWLHDALRSAFDERNIGDYGLVESYPSDRAAGVIERAGRFLDAAEGFLRPDSHTPRIAVMLSGGGRTLLNLIDSIKRGEIQAEIAVVISSLPQVKGVERAKAAGLPVIVIRKKDHPDVGEFSGLIAAAIDEYKPDLVCQAGWTCYWRIPDRWLGKVMNIHPALLPKFGGKGFYGHHVHEAVLAAGERTSGCTVHFANNEYDAGPIILQRTVPVLPNDTADDLAERVFAQECIAYPAAIRLFLKGHLRLEGNQVLLVRPGRGPIPPKLAVE